MKSLEERIRALEERQKQQITTPIDNRSLQVLKAALVTPVLSQVPTQPAQNGTIVLTDVAGVRRMYAFVNGTWRYSTLT